MDEQTLRKQVADSMAVILVRLLRRDVTITEDTELMSELSLSSSLALELLLELEEELAIQIDVEQLDQDAMVTVGDLAGYIAAHSIPQ